jgi:hypothetical protein
MKEATRSSETSIGFKRITTQKIELFNGYENREPEMQIMFLSTYTHTHTHKGPPISEIVVLTKN